MATALAAIGSFFWTGATAATATTAATAGGLTTAGTIAASAAASAAAGALTRGNIAIPPNPFMPQAQVDQTTAEAEAAARKRQGIQGGLDSTIGTSGGGAGGMLNPTSLGTKSLLGQ